MTKIVWALAILLTIGFADVALAGPGNDNDQGSSQGDQGQNNGEH
jgi:hypothetical protein